MEFGIGVFFSQGGGVHKIVWHVYIYQCQYVRLWFIINQAYVLDWNKYWKIYLSGPGSHQVNGAVAPANNGRYHRQNQAECIVRGIQISKVHRIQVAIAQRDNGLIAVRRADFVLHRTIAGDENVNVIGRGSSWLVEHRRGRRFEAKVLNKSWRFKTKFLELSEQILAS